MSEAVDYFSNHRLKRRFPWSLYHRPIVENLGRVMRHSPGPDVLNVGSGPFFELDSIGSYGRAGRRVTVCDIDPRAVELAKQIHGEAIAGADVIQADAPLPYADGSFDLVVSMDVIEHVPEPLPWLRDVMRVLRPGGLLFLTTPNYASLSLDIIERTALEGIARVQGFSRKELHPSKMTPARLRNLLDQAGAVDTEIHKIALGWVLASESLKP